MLYEVITNAEIMHIDIDPAEIGKNIKVHYPLNGDIKAILRRIIEAVEVNEDKKAWINQIKEWKEKFNVITSYSIHYTKLYDSLVRS